MWYCAALPEVIKSSTLLSFGWETTKPEHTLQMVTAHDSPHAMLGACWRVTGGANSCYLLVRFRSKGNIFWVDFPVEHWTVTSAWPGFPQSQEGHCCSDWGEQRSSIDSTIHVWHDQCGVSDGSGHVYHVPMPSSPGSSPPRWWRQRRLQHPPCS